MSLYRAGAAGRGLPAAWLAEAHQGDAALGELAP